MSMSVFALLAFAPPAAVSGSLTVPLDYSARRAGTATISYELGQPFDHRKPTLIVVADGQQFFVRKGRMAAVVKPYGSDLNVVGIIGRADAPTVAKAVKRPDGTIDWVRAWRFFRSSQWVEDIESVRRRLVGPAGKVLLTGASGGAMLVHEYLAQHGEHVSRAFTAASVMPWIERELGIRPPSFWATLSPELQRGLLATLRNRPRDRQVIATAFQRLHFFVLPEKLPKARDDLVRSLAAGDAEAFRKVRRDYQVDAVLAFLNTDVAIPIRVREYEFLAGAGRLAAPRQGEFEPEVEAMFDYALPLIELRRAGRIGAPKWNARRLHHLETQVLVLAGLRDEATDYRSSISLAARYPMGRIVILDDNHVFARSSAGGARRTIERAFLVGGFASIAYQDAEKSIDAYRWKGG